MFVHVVSCMFVVPCHLCHVHLSCHMCCVYPVSCHRIHTAISCDVYMLWYFIDFYDVVCVLNAYMFVCHSVVCASNINSCWS